MSEVAKELETVTEQYYSEIYKYCRRRVNTDDTAFDITQNVFLALSERYLSIDRVSIRKWLYETARHKIADYYRELQKTKDNITDVPVNNIDAESNGLFYDPYNEIKDEDIERLVKSITDKLDTEDRNLYIDRFVNKTDYNVLADKYTVSEQAMRKRVSRLRARILKIIHELLGMIIMLIII